MQRDFKLRKRAILAGLGLLLLADVALAFYSWKMSSASRTPQQVLAQQSVQLKLLKADIEHARDIRAKIPVYQKEFDQFESGLPPAGKGYSSITAEIGAIAHKADVRLEDVKFHQKEIPGRGLSEVEMELAVSGEYASVVRFLNGLQRSGNVYAVDSLALDSQIQTQGASAALRVYLKMKTYFRAT